jgi:hypothetical protein
MEIVRTGHEPVASSCKERERLMTVYLGAAVENAQAGKGVPDKKSEAWREATQLTRASCIDALADLTSHRAEHGC